MQRQKGNLQVAKAKVILGCGIRERLIPAIELADYWLRDSFKLGKKTDIDVVTEKAGYSTQILFRSSFERQKPIQEAFAAKETTRQVVTLITVQERCPLHNTNVSSMHTVP